MVICVVISGHLMQEAAYRSSPEVVGEVVNTSGGVLSAVFHSPSILVYPIWLSVTHNAIADLQAKQGLH